MLTQTIVSIHKTIELIYKFEIMCIPESKQRVGQQKHCVSQEQHRVDQRNPRVDAQKHCADQQNIIIYILYININYCVL